MPCVIARCRPLRLREPRERVVEGLGRHGNPPLPPLEEAVATCPAIFDRGVFIEEISYRPLHRLHRGEHFRIFNLADMSSSENERERKNENLTKKKINQEDYNRLIQIMETDGKHNIC